MPNNSGCYPGVDPDARQPGGLIAAGNIDAASMSIAGQPIAQAVQFTPITGLSIAGTQDFTSTENNALLFDTIDYDYSGSADLSNNGISVAASGLYLASFFARTSSAMAANGHMHIIPTCIGAGDAHPAIEELVNLDNLSHIIRTWYFHLVIPAPDTFVIYITNSFSVTVTFDHVAFSLKRLY